MVTMVEQPHSLRDNYMLSNYNKSASQIKKLPGDHSLATIENETMVSTVFNQGSSTNFNRERTSAAGFSSNFSPYSNRELDFTIHTQRSFG